MLSTSIYHPCGFTVATMCRPGAGPPPQRRLVLWECCTGEETLSIESWRCVIVSPGTTNSDSVSVLASCEVLPLICQTSSFTLCWPPPPSPCQSRTPVRDSTDPHAAFLSGVRGGEWGTSGGVEVRAQAAWSCQTEGNFNSVKSDFIGFWRGQGTAAAAAASERNIWMKNKQMERYFKSFGFISRVRLVPNT